MISLVDMFNQEPFLFKVSRYAKSKLKITAPKMTNMGYVPCESLPQYNR